MDELSFPNLPVVTKAVELSAMPNLSTKFSSESLSNLMAFLESKSSDTSFPTISVLPDFLKSALSFVNERKRIKIEQEQFSLKISFAQEAIDKRLNYELKRLDRETDLQIAAIKGDVQTRLAQIDRFYDAAIKKIEHEYNLKREEMIARYEYLERCRRDQKERSKELLIQVRKQRQDSAVCSKEIRDVSAVLARKIKNGTITESEFQHYLLLKHLQLQSITSMQEALCVLVGNIE